MKHLLFSIATILVLSFRAIGQANLPKDFSIPQPQIPSKTFNITDFGAVGDGKTLNTQAFHKVMTAVDQAGGGTVEIPVGRFITGPFALTSNLNLHVAKDATIAFSDNRKDFRLIDGGYEICLTANNCHDIAVTGEGTIDGQGQSWWKEFRAFKEASKDETANAVAPPHRPYMIMLTECTRVMFKNITLANSPMFHFVPRLCRDVTIDSITIKSPADSPNTDGIDPSGWNYHIVNCTIDTGDDNIALKPRPVPDPDHLSCENFLVEHCTFLHGHGMSIGGGSNGGVRNMLVRDCTFIGTDNGVRLKSGRDRGGLVENLTYENLTMKDVKNAIIIVSFYPTIPQDPGADKMQKIAPKTPIWRHIRISKVIADGSESAVRILGLPEMPIEDVTLSDVRITAKNGVQITNSNDIQMENCQITSAP